MKKILPVFIVFISLTLYGYHTSAFSTGAPYNTKINADISYSTEHQCFNLPSSSTNNQIEKNESPFSIYTNTPVKSLNNPFFKFLAYPSAIENHFISAYTQYKYLTLSLLIQLQQTKITFPFHYFW